VKSNKTLVGISYGRVSTDGQFKDASGNVKDDASPAMQRKRCQEFVEGLSLQKNSSYKIIEHLEDNGYSGKNTDRPQFQRLVRLIKSKKIQFVIVTELSRLSRSNADFHEFIKLCKDSSVELHILNIQGLDLNSPMSSVILSLMAALAQMERELTSQRVKAGARQRLKSEGKINGAKELLGLDPDLSPNRLGHFIANPGELDSVEKILEVFLKSASKDETLNEVSRRAIKGKHGKELTEANLNTILKNCAWKYRGLWELNRKNKDQDQDDLHSFLLIYSTVF
jgi:site-specific DNA recombinase